MLGLGEEEQRWVPTILGGPLVS